MNAKLIEQLVDFKKSPKNREVMKNFVYSLQKLYSVQCISCRDYRNKVQVCRPTLFRRRQIHTFHAGSKTGSGSEKV